MQAGFGREEHGGEDGAERVVPECNSEWLQDLEGGVGEGVPVQEIGGWRE